MKLNNALQDAMRTEVGSYCATDFDTGYTAFARTHGAVLGLATKLGWCHVELSRVASKKGVLKPYARAGWCLSAWLLYPLVSNPDHMAKILESVADVIEEGNQLRKHVGQGALLLMSKG